MRRRRWLTAAAAAALAGCTRRPAPFHRLRIGLIPRFNLAPLYLADELGFFRRAGLEVEFHRSAESAQLLPLLVGGHVQVGMNQPTPGFINAVLKGARMRIVAARDMAAPACQSGGAIFGSRRAFPQGLRDLRALKGKRVCVTTQASLNAFLLDLMLEFAGLTTDDITLLVMRLPEATAALIAGRVDAVPAINLDKDLDFVSPNVVRSTTLSELLPNYQYTFMIFGPALLESAPETGIRFLWAYLRGVREFRSGRTPRALEELARAAHQDPAAARAACREGVSPDGRPDRASVQRFADWAAKKKFVPRAVDASELVDPRFVEEANRRLQSGWAS